MHKHPEQVGVAGLITIACMTLVLAGGVNIGRQYTFDVERYAKARATATLRADAWWNTEWQRLPAARIDLAGEVEEPLAIQWTGDLASLQAMLLAKGWRAPAPWTPFGTLTWLNTDADPVALPVLPSFASGRLLALRPRADRGSCCVCGPLTWCLQTTVRCQFGQVRSLRNDWIVSFRFSLLRPHSLKSTLAETCWPDNSNRLPCCSLRYEVEYRTGWSDTALLRKPQ